MQKLKVEGIQEIHWVRVTQESLLFFSILKLKERADCIKTIANRWREQNDFGIDDMLVFDGELIDSLRR